MSPLLEGLIKLHVAYQGHAAELLTQSSDQGSLSWIQVNSSSMPLQANDLGEPLAP